MMSSYLFWVSVRMRDLCWKMSLLVPNSFACESRIRQWGQGHLLRLRMDVIKTLIGTMSEIHWRAVSPVLLWVVSRVGENPGIKTPGDPIASTWSLSCVHTHARTPHWVAPSTVCGRLLYGNQCMKNKSLGILAPMNWAAKSLKLSGSFEGNVIRTQLLREINTHCLKVHRMAAELTRGLTMSIFWFISKIEI